MIRDDVLLHLIWAEQLDVTVRTFAVILFGEAGRAYEILVSVFIPLCLRHPFRRQNIREMSEFLSSSLSLCLSKSLSLSSTLLCSYPSMLHETIRYSDRTLS
jgi:hypothetical protein